MVQDVIDLRKDEWIPRRTDNKPKMINEIENDIKNELIVQQSISLACNRPEKRDHRHKFRGGKKKGRRMYHKFLLIIKSVLDILKHLKNIVVIVFFFF